MDNIEVFKTKLLLRNLSERTIYSYISVLNLISKRLCIPIDDISELDLANYMVVDGNRSMSGSTQMAIINAFKSYYKEVHKKKFDHDVLPRPVVEQKHPDILSIDEFQKILDITNNLKHRTIMALMYSCGLRVSEVINLKINDIDAKNNKINIRNAKGKVSRVTILDPKILELLRKYWHEYKTSEFLFEGSKGGKYSIKSVQSIVKGYAKRAGITKRISSHSLRHSCLTQLIKNGIDLRTVQKIAGHKNINTTAGYIQLVDKDILDTPSPISSIKI